MARVPYLRPAAAESSEPGLNNISAVLAHSEAVRVAVSSFTGAFHEHAHVALRLREMTILRAAAVSGSNYEWGRHVVLARARLGLDDEVVEALRTGDSSTLSADEAVAVRLAEAVARRQVDDELWQEATDALGVAEAVELTFLAAFYAGLARAMDALQLDLDPEMTVVFDA